MRKRTLASIILCVGLATSTSVVGWKHLQLIKKHNNLTQEYSQAIADVNQLNQEYEQAKQEHSKTLEALTQLDKNYQELLTKNKQTNQQYTKIEKENKQIVQDSNEVNKKLEELTKEHEKLSQENNLLNQTYKTIASENEQLRKKQEELREKEAKTLEELTREHISLTEYRPGYGFPNYKEGLLHKQNNWESEDTLDNKGWQVINKKAQEIKQGMIKLKYLDLNFLSFQPSNFASFSADDNYATFHLYSSKPIKTFILGGEYNIKKKGYLNISISPNNKNWAVIDSFNSRNQNNYRFGYFTPYNIDHFPKLKIDKDLFIRHSVGALSNKDYEVEIWNFFTSITTK